MSDKKTIAIDIDDVIADSTESMRLLVNERTGANLTQDHYRQAGEYRRYYERVWREHGLADQLDFNKLYAEMGIDQSNIPLLSGADSAISELSKKFHIVIVTARDNFLEVATRKWFKQRFDNENVELYFCDNQTDSRTKGQLCKELGAELLIDDNPGHCQSALDEGVKAILFGSYGWHTFVPEGVVNCKTWAEVQEYITNGTR